MPELMGVNISNPIRLLDFEVKELLKDYYDIPQKIAEEFAAIRNCEAEKNRIALPSVNLSGLPGGKGLPGDRMVLTNITKYYDNEIRKCYRRIAERISRAIRKRTAA